LRKENRPWQEGELRELSTITVRDEREKSGNQGPSVRRFTPQQKKKKKKKGLVPPLVIFNQGEPAGREWTKGTKRAGNLTCFIRRI